MAPGLVHLPDRDDSSHLHHQLLRRCHSTRVSPLAASIACEMMRHEWEPLQVLVCWWIAIKFEEVTPPGIMELLDDYNLKQTYEAVCKVEWELLGYFGFQIPFRTRIREMYNHSRRDTVRGPFDDWCYVLLYSNLHPLCAADEWIVMLGSETLSSMLSLALSMCHKRIKRAIPPRPESSLKRKSE